MGSEMCIRDRGGVAQDHPGCPVRCCSGASCNSIHSHFDSSLLVFQVNRARLAWPLSPGSLPKITGLICLPRITGFMNEGQPKAMTESTGAPTVVLTTTGSPSPPEPVARPCISAASDPDMMKVKWCSLCNEVKVVPPITRCRDCNRVYQRMFAFRNSLDQTSLLIWDNMSGDRKAAFVKGVKGLHMKANMCAAVNQELESHFCSWLQLTMFHGGNGSLKTLRDMIKI